MNNTELPGTRLTDSGPRTIRQPGLASAERCIAVPVAAMPIAATLPAGVLLLDALHALLGQEYDGACLSLAGGGLSPFAYVMPAKSPDADHAAFYSTTFRPAGETQFGDGTVTVGFRDNKPFFHCHAVWTEANGHRGCGHVLPEETMIAAPIEVHGAGIIGARFEVHPDRETGYSLLVPVATERAQPPGARRGVALRLAPNQEITAALEQAGAKAGFARAVIAGGVGSTIGVHFEAAPPITGYATELLVRHAMICCDGSGSPTEIDIAVVDLNGAIGEGRLKTADNPVLITFEGVLLQA